MIGQGEADVNMAGSFCIGNVTNRVIQERAPRQCHPGFRFNRLAAVAAPWPCLYE